MTSLSQWKNSFSFQFRELSLVHARQGLYHGATPPEATPPALNGPFELLTSQFHPAV